jgi:hypothetical protein
MAFDGQNMWILEPGLTQIEVLNANDGVPASFSPIAFAGTTPDSIAYDGRYMWVTDSAAASTSVYVYDATSGAPVLGSPLGVGASPKGIAFDGRYMWIAIVATTRYPGCRLVPERSPLPISSRSLIFLMV